MPLFGAHMSIAGGYYKALQAAQSFSCESVQLFTKNTNQWRAKEFSDQDVELFHGTLKQVQLGATLAHDSYLINLASPDEVLYRRSIEAFVIELQRAERLGLDFLVTHPGAYMTGCEESGLERVVGALDEAHRACRGFRVQVLLETTAGQGTCLGHRFEHLARVVNGVKESHRLGVCFDTCHVFAAGYRLSPRYAYRNTIREFDRVIGLDRLRAFHINDSAKPFGSRVDRHAHIGQGCIGLEAFGLLVNDRRFRRHPMILETPKESTEAGEMDAINLATLRGLVPGVPRTAQVAKAIRR